MDQDLLKAVHQAQKGEAQAANFLIEHHYRPVFAFLRRLVSSDQDAADLTQRTFTRVWQALPTFAGRSSFNSWIHGIAYHVYLDWRRGEHPAEPHSDEWWLARPAKDPWPDEFAARSDIRRVIYRIVDSLPADLRETVHLHYYQGLTLEETSAAMGVASSTVKYRLRQALNQVQSALRSIETPDVITFSRL